MRYAKSVYTDYSQFLAQATQCAKDKINLFNTLVDPPARKKLEGNAFQKFLQFIIFLLKRVGWMVYVAIAGLLGLGFLGFFGGMGTLIASNPVLAAAVVALGGSGIYLVWKNRDIYLAHATVGKRYKVDFESLVKEHSDLEVRAVHVDHLLWKCVESICVEVFSINSDAFMSKVREEQDSLPAA